MCEGQAFLFLELYTFREIVFTFCYSFSILLLTAASLNFYINVSSTSLRLRYKPESFLGLG